MNIAALIDHAEPPGGVRVLVATKPVPDRAAWTAVALLRPLGAHRHVVAQRVPPELFAARPLHVRFEIAYSTAAFAFDQKVEQQCWMKWIAVMGR